MEAEINYIIDGSFSPFMVIIRENSEDGNIVDNRIIQESGEETYFGDYDIDYYVQVWDTGGGFDQLPPINIPTP